MNRIKEARERAGVSQSELARRMETTNQMVSQWEGGIRNPSTESLKKAAIALGVGIRDLADPAIYKAKLEEIQARLDVIWAEMVEWSYEPPRSRK